MKVISLINMKGGVGKTTLSVNIAECLVRKHNKKVLIVDIDPQFNATQCLFTTEQYMEHLRNKRETIIDVFDRDTRVNISVVDGVTESSAKQLSDIKPVEIKSNLWCLPGNLELCRLEIAPGEGRENRLKKYLEKNSDAFDYVIIDTPPTPSLWMTSALIASDFYLIPVKADPISLTGIEMLNSIVSDKKDSFDLDIKCIGLVLTITENKTNVYNLAKESISGNKRWRKLLYRKELPKRTEVAAKQLNNFILDLNDTAIKSALSGIVDEMLTRIENES